MHALSLIPLLFAIPSLATLQHVEFPHLIIPLNKNHANTAYGTQKNSTVSDYIWTEISFDVPADVPAAICRVNFNLNLNPVKKAPWKVYGNPPYDIEVRRLEPTINKDKDTWNASAFIKEYVATILISKEGTVEVLDGWFECPKGDVAQFIMLPTAPLGMDFSWFELDYPWSEGGPHGITLEMHT
jgi:hypothetical protein